MTTMKVTVRMYHLGFGECFLLTLEHGRERHRVMVDFGVHSGSRRTDEDVTFESVVRDVVHDLGPSPHLDVLVISHRHRDHLHAFRFRDLWAPVSVGEIWMPWVEDPTDPVATGIKDRQGAAAELVHRSLTALSAAFSATPASNERLERKQAEIDDALSIVYNSTTNAEAFEQLCGPGGFTDPARQPRGLPPGAARRRTPSGTRR